MPLKLMKAVLAMKYKAHAPEKGCLCTVKAQKPLSECCAFLFPVGKTLPKPKVML